MMQNELLHTVVRLVIQNMNSGGVHAGIREPILPPDINVRRVGMSSNSPSISPISTRISPQVSPQISPQESTSEPITKPGCTAADEALVVHGHLRGLAEGWGGFGVLRESKKHLERASEAAHMAKAPDIAHQLADIAEKLPNVHSPEEAKILAQELEPLLPKAWELGRKCGLSRAMWQKANELALSVKDGKITKEQAISELKQMVKV